VRKLYRPVAELPHFSDRNIPNPVSQAIFESDVSLELHPKLVSSSGRIPVSQRAPEKNRRFGLKTRLLHSARRLGRAMEVVAAAVGPICPDRKARGESVVGPHTIRYYCHLPTDGSLLADWDALSRQTPGATVFQSPDWQRAVARSADAIGRLRLITVHEEGRLTGVIPLERRWGGHLWSMGLLTTAYHDPLIALDHPEQTWAAALQGLVAMCPETRSVTFERLSPDTQLGVVANAARGTGFSGGQLVPSVTTDTQIDLAPQWDTYLGKLKGHDRKELRRKIRRVEEYPNARFTILDTPETVLPALDPLLRLMERDGGAKGRKARWLFRRHLRDCAKPLSATGRLTVYQLLIDDQLAAGVIALTQGDRQLLWNTAMNGAFAKWSPGIVLFGMILRRAIELRQPSIDLLLGLMPYKYALGAVERPLYSLTLTR
jgi:CelD/BcsL family acetyltransferase involved in cellulose biosynthesis